MATDYRLALGTLSAAALTTSYLLSALPLQSDQLSTLVNPWDLVGDDGSTFPRAARYVTMADGSQRADGFIQWDWVFPYWTEGMVAYFENAFFGIYQSALVTARTRTHTGVYQTYNATLLRPIPNEHLGHEYLGVSNYRLRFLRALVAT